MSGIVLNISSFQAFLALFGPLLVAAVTGLKTSSAIKAGMAIAVVAIIVAFQVIMNGGLTADLFGNIMVVAVVFQTTYTLLWKNTPIAKYLQEKFPIQFGEAAVPELEVEDEVLPEEFLDEELVIEEPVEGTEPGTPEEVVE